MDFAPRRVAVVVERYPCLSESFVRRDLAGLESRGFTMAVVACAARRRCDTSLASELRAAVIRREDRMSRDVWRHKARVAVGLPLNLVRARSFFAPSPRGAAAAARASWIAAAVQPQLQAWKPDWIHAHFLGLPSVVACLLSDRLGLPFSISAHARDIFVPVVRIASLCARARFVAACSEYARASLMGLLPIELAARIEHLPHDVACGSIIPEREIPYGVPIRLLSVCRLVSKKGIDVVLSALALLPASLPYCYRIVGDGPELPRLRALASELGLERVEFAGALPPESIPEELARAHVFLLGTRTAPDGDRDGIPNALLEAIAAGLPVVVSDAGAVSEVVRDRHTGWLVPPDNPRAFADAIRDVVTHPDLRRSVTASAHAEVCRRFSSASNSAALAKRLEAEFPTGVNRGNWSDDFAVGDCV